MPPMKTSPVHRYFSYDEENKISTCQLCNKHLKGKHVTNLKTHLAMKHRDELNVIENINEDIKRNNSKPTSSENSSNTTDKLKKLCLKLVTAHGRPLAMMEDDAFQEILKLAALNAEEGNQINSKSIKDMVYEQAYIIREKIWQETKHKLISLKLDSATCADRKFLGINIQYVRNGNIVIRNLSVLEVTKSQTAVFLKECLDEVLVEHRISLDNIYCVCTDNGANMVKMVKLIGGTYINDDGKQQQEESDDESFISEERYPQSYLMNDEDAEWTVNNVIVSEMLGSCLTSHDRKIRGMLCAAHTLQLAVKDAFKEDKHAQTIINVARRTVNVLRQPNQSNKLKEANLKKPINDCATRWTSTFKMLERLLTHQDYCRENMFTLPDNFWSDVKSLLTCLHPVNLATMELQQKNLTIGDFFITWQNCKCNLEKVQMSFAVSLHKAMTVREEKLLTNDVVLEGLYIDRRLNVILNLEQCAKAKSLLKETYDRISNVANTNLEAQESASTAYHNISDVPGTSRTSGFEEMLLMADRVRGNSTHVNSFECGLNELICAPRIPLHENILMYWNNSLKKSIISDVATTVLSAPATQVSVERLFSSLKFILNPLRSNLSPRLLKDIMTIRENKDLLD